MASPTLTLALQELEAHAAEDRAALTAVAARAAAAAPALSPTLNAGARALDLQTGEVITVDRTETAHTFFAPASDSEG